MQLRRDEVKLYREDADIRPNRYCAMALCLMAVIAQFILIINELGIFLVNKLPMRIGIGVAMCSICLLQAPALNQNWAAWRGMKYLMVGCITMVITVAEITLQFHTTILLLLPLLVTAMYPSEHLAKFAILASMVSILVSVIVSVLIGTWSPSFLQFLLEVSMQSKVEVVAAGEYPLLDSLAEALFYVAMPRMMITAACGFVVVAINRHSEARVMDTIRVLHMSESDALTDLHNRRSYDEHLEKFPEICMRSAACLYLDANGLHVLNKEKGHAAGDALLCCVAEAVRDQFGDEDTYRIGGDEFVALAADVPLEELQRRIAIIRKTVQDAGYSVAVGMEQNSVPCTMSPLVLSAEAKMFADKKRIYEEARRKRAGGLSHADDREGA